MSDELKENSSEVVEVKARVLIVGKAQYNVMQSRDFLTQKGIEAIGVFSLKEALQNYTRLKPTHAFFSVSLGAAKIDGMAAMFKKSLNCDCYIFPDDANNRESMAELKNSSVQYKMRFNVTGAGIYRVVEPWLREKNVLYYSKEKERAKEKQALREKLKEQLKSVAPDSKSTDEDEAKLQALAAEDNAQEQKKKARALKKALKKKHAEKLKQEGEQKKKDKKPHWSESKDKETQFKSTPEISAAAPLESDEIDLSGLIDGTHIDAGHVTVVEAGQSEGHPVLARREADEVDAGTVRVLDKKLDTIGSVTVIEDKVSTIGAHLEESPPVEATQETEIEEIEIAPEEFSSIAFNNLDSEGEIVIDVTPIETPESLEVPATPEAKKYFEGPNVGTLHIKSDEFAGYAIFLFSEAKPNMDVLKLRVEDNLKVHLNKTKQRPIDQALSVGISEFESTGDTLGFIPQLIVIEGERIIFVEGENRAPSITPSAQADMIAIELARLSTDFAVTFDVYIRLDLNQKYVKYVASGEKITEAQKDKLGKRNVDRVHIKLADKEKFENYCKLAFMWSLRNHAA